MPSTRDKIFNIREKFQPFREQIFLVIGCHMVLRRLSCDTIVLNSHVPTEDKRNASNDIFCDELEQVFDHFLKYYVKIMFEHFIANFWDSRFLKLKIRN